MSRNIHEGRKKTKTHTATSITNRDEILSRSGETLDYANELILDSLGTGDIVEQEPGTSAGAGFTRIVKHPFNVDGKTTLRIKAPLELPYRVSAGVSLSQRVPGEYAVMEQVGLDDNGVPETDGVSYPAKSISANITVASNVWTITFATAHGLYAGDLVYIKGCTDSRLNVGLVAVTAVVDALNITITSTLTNGTYTVGSGSLEYVDPTMGAINQIGAFWDGTTATNGRMTVRSFGGPEYTSASTAFTTNWTNGAVPSGYSGPYTISVNPVAQTDMIVKHDRVSLSTVAIDSTSTVPTMGIARNSIVPQFRKIYQTRFRFYGQANRSVPVGGGIVSAVKSGSTTATITFRSAHGLTTSDFIMIYGIRDQTNFANLTTATAVASTPTSTTITIAFGASATATSYGGFVYRINGGNVAAPVNISVQSVSSVTAGELTVVCNATAAVAGNVGEYVWLGGVEKNDGSGTFTTTGWAEGMYKILKNDTTTFNVILSVPGLSTFGSTNVGGALLKATELRIHWLRYFDWDTMTTELQPGYNPGDAGQAFPVNVTAAVITSGAVTVSGANAHDSATLSNPVVVGARGSNALITAVANNDTVTNITDLRSRGIVFGSSVRELQTIENTTITASTTETTIAAAVASVLKDLKGIVLANTSATATRVDIRDSTAGTIRLSVMVPAGQTVPLMFTEPLKQNAANNNWTATCGTSITDLRVMVQSIQS